MVLGSCVHFDVLHFCFQELWDFNWMYPGHSTATGHRANCMSNCVYHLLLENEWNALCIMFFESHGTLIGCIMFFESYGTLIGCIMFFESHGTLIGCIMFFESYGTLIGCIMF